jgi:CRISPR/Cas system CSM-associated protein Csm5 (group 7 of RAMP superfamily)
MIFSRKLLLSLAVALFAAFSLCGCNAFRELFGGKNWAEGHRKAEERRKEKKEAAEQRRHRDPVSDMFSLENIRDTPTNRYRGSSLSAEERNIFRSLEDEADREREFIKAEHERMRRSTSEQSDWVFSFKPEK